MSSHSSEISDSEFKKMPRCCIAASCDTVSGKGYSFHKFPKDDALQRRWVSAVKQQQSNWNGPSKDSQLCSKHFEEDCFITDGVCFREEMGIPMVKRLKTNTVPTIFARSVDYIQTSSSTQTSRPLSERRHQRSVRLDGYMCTIRITCSI